jgi:hypothetical protein
LARAPESYEVSAIALPGNSSGVMVLTFKLGVLLPVIGWLVSFLREMWQLSAESN